jgi:membrane associated rhomboid family serine protease
MFALFMLTIFWRDPANWCLSPTSWLVRYPLVSLFLSTYTHLSFFHIFFNMSVFVFYGTTYERKWGSTKFWINLVLAGLLSNIIHTFLALMIYAIPGIPDFIISNLVRTCSVGISGVLFFFMAIDCFDPEVQPGDGIQVFGLVPVPKKYYPWIMLALMQLLIVHVSFLGHLSGLLLGLLYARDRFRILHIRSSWFDYIDNHFLTQSYLAPRAMWMMRNPLPGADAPVSVSFTQALQQQLHTMFPLRPQPENNLGDRAVPAQAASNVTSFSDLPRGPTSSSAPHTPSSASQFPGQGHTLGGR